MHRGRLRAVETVTRGRWTRARHGRALAMAVVSAILAGCTADVAMDKLSASIREGLAAQTGAFVAGVSCPPSRALKAGDTFECTAVLDGGTLPVRVTQQDGEGGLKWEVAEAVLQVAALERTIAAGTTSRFKGPVEVECGPRFRPARPRDHFRCTATSRGRTHPVDVIVTDAQGNVHWEIAPR